LNAPVVNVHAPQSCATCSRTDCHLSFVSRHIEPVTAQTAFVMDEIWPEYYAFLAEHRKDGDQVLAPGLLGARPVRYGWEGGGHPAGWATFSRHMTMRRVVRARGAVRQAAYLKEDEHLALALSRHLDYRAQHLVVYQNFLPFLWREGVLGGRSFDVLMTRYPLRDLHAKLDAFHVQHRDSLTIADFRAPEAVVAAEAEGLAVARRIVTPHHDIAESFGERAVWLDWQRPGPMATQKGDRVAFLGPALTRQGVHEVRDLAHGLAKPLIVFGEMLESVDIWGDLLVEHRAKGADWLNGITAILHPAAITNQPRALLQAIANGVTVYAHPSCGLAPDQFLPLSAFRGGSHIEFL